jgi:hypothetical protein
MHHAWSSTSSSDRPELFTITAHRHSPAESPASLLRCCSCVDASLLAATMGRVSLVKAGGDGTVYRRSSLYLLPAKSALGKGANYAVKAGFIRI